MQLGPEHLFGAIGVGVGATLLMDLWNLFLRRAFGIPSLNYCLLGRWVRHLPTGRLRHANIGTAAAMPAECAVGWVAHYSIGVALALGLVFLTAGSWLTRPTLAVGLLFGVATVVFPFFVLQPSLGLGVASAKAPRPGQARLKSLATHTVFGVGLYLSALAVGYLVGMR